MNYENSKSLIDVKFKRLVGVQRSQVIIINQGEDTSFEEDLAKDVLEMITVFSARLYGSRSRKNPKLLESVKQAVEQGYNNYFTVIITL